MSDSKKITESRNGDRAKLDHEARKLLAAEQTADALEGIRTDLTHLSVTLSQVVQQLTNIGVRIK